MTLKKSILAAIPVQYQNTREPDLDPDLMPLSKCFTVFFWVTCFSVVFGATLKYAISKQREIVQVPDSTATDALTFAEYSNIAHENPICPCSNPAIPIGSFATITPSFYPLITNLLRLVDDKASAEQAYREFPALEIQFQEQSVAASLFLASNLAVRKSITGLQNSAFVMSQLVPKKVVEQDLFARLIAIRTAGSAALLNAIRSMFVWASFNLPYITLATNHGDYNEPIQFLLNTSSSPLYGQYSNLYGVFEDFLPQVGISVGYNLEKGFCSRYGKGCDPFENKLAENITSFPSARAIFPLLDSLCKDPSNTTARDAMSYYFPANFTQWCWVSGMQQFQEQDAYPANERLSVWSDVIETLTVYDLNITVNHEILYTSCAPVSCSYASVHYPSVGQVVSYATSLYGGVASIAGSIYAALWAFKLKHTQHKKKKKDKQDQQIAQLRQTSEALPQTKPTAAQTSDDQLP